MKSTKIDKLINTWLEGETSLEEERILRDYFCQDHVEPHHEVYKPMFRGFEAASKEVSGVKIELPASGRPAIRPFWYSIAALLVVTFTIATLVRSGSGLSQEEEEALAALKQTKEVMLLMSENLNKGTENVALLDVFRKGTSSLRHIDQFNEATNKFLK